MMIEFLYRSMNIGQMLNGLAGPVSAIPPVLSCGWFPAKQRVTATSITTSAAFGGIAASMVLGTRTLAVVFPVVPQLDVLGCFCHTTINPHLKCTWSVLKILWIVSKVVGSEKNHT